jgi:hypothetical protein
LSKGEANQQMIEERKMTESPALKLKGVAKGGNIPGKLSWNSKLAAVNTQRSLKS